MSDPNVRKVVEEGIITISDSSDDDISVTVKPKKRIVDFGNKALSIKSFFDSETKETVANMKLEVAPQVEKKRSN